MFSKTHREVKYLLSWLQIFPSHWRIGHLNEPLYSCPRQFYFYRPIYESKMSLNDTWVFVSKTLSVQGTRGKYVYYMSLCNKSGMKIVHVTWICFTRCKNQGRGKNLRSRTVSQIVSNLTFPTWIKYLHYSLQVVLIHWHGVNGSFMCHVHLDPGNRRTTSQER